MKLANIIRTMAVVMLIGLLIGVSQNRIEDRATKDPIIPTRDLGQKQDPVQKPEEKPVIEKITKIPS
ncbi:MAG: hypothetical protein Q4A75_07220 [Peptostreptococcaceae bacterium]|nr:hypothetical protein [Peptostreptococcaceae bacterium]